MKTGVGRRKRGRAQKKVHGCSEGGYVAGVTEDRVRRRHLIFYGDPKGSSQKKQKKNCWVVYI